MIAISRKLAPMINGFKNHSMNQGLFGPGCVHHEVMAMIRLTLFLYKIREETVSCIRIWSENQSEGREMTPVPGPSDCLPLRGQI